ncbi:MAG: hypothetical protein KGL53_00105, partial [Elusimicrobia bacterium]|nr:hypothetical protein [Elusimicrobiota bacterium]
IKALSRSRRRALVFDFTPMRNSHAYVDWQTSVVRLSSSLLKTDPRRAAPILIHELTHVLQKSRSLPYHAFELEHEAFLVTIRTAHELGVRYPRSDFQGEAQRRFEGDLDKYVAWLLRQHESEDNISLLSGSRKEFLEKLYARRTKKEASVRTAERALAKARGTYRTMRSSGYAAESLEYFRKGELDPARENVRYAKGSLALVERDIQVLESLGGYARYRAFADSLNKKAAALHRRLAR